MWCQPKNYNVMSETSKRKKYLMWYKVNELFSKNYKKSQIASLTGLHRQTVSKYLKMTEEEFCRSQSFERQYHHKLEAYERFILGELRLCASLSAPQIHDHLKENFADLPEVSGRTVFSCVERIRAKYGIAREDDRHPRPYEKQPETPYGRFAQVDFGERWQKDALGNSVKVYFFAMVMSRSRHKYVYFSDRPFTTAMAVYAHELAFQFYGGVPERIMYDQDRVFIRDVNLGDLILTAGFKKLVSECGFTPVFCHKSDPESKGKIENMVRYVKYNFLRGRLFKDIDTLNREAMGWLERTANGTEHHGTRKVPAAEFETEKDHLLPYCGVPSSPVEDMLPYHVRKDNVITYHGNYYTVPTGTYKGQGSKVYVVEKDGELSVFSIDTGKTICTHRIPSGKGNLVRDRSHQRDRTKSIDEYESQIRALLPADEVITDYLAQMRKDRGRHYRDNLKYMKMLGQKYEGPLIVEAVTRCRECRVYNAQSLTEVAESLRKIRGGKLRQPAISITSADLAATTDATPEKTDIKTFEPLFI